MPRACKLGAEGIVSKRLGSPYHSGRSPDWLKMKNATAPAVKREEDEKWGNGDDGQEEAHDLRLIPFLVDRPLSDHDKERSERTTGTSGQSDI